MYLIDANVLMTAADFHYPEDVSPGFWREILTLLDNGTAQVPESVYSELIAYQGKWVTGWVKSNIDPAHILGMDANQLHVLVEITKWVTSDRKPDYKRSDISRFLSGADPKIIAAAVANGNSTIVTYEKGLGSNGGLKVKIPDVASRFNVGCVSPIQMLRTEKRRI